MPRFFIFLLIFSACFMTGCQNKSNTDSNSFAELPLSSFEKTSFDIYDKFTTLEIEQMEYSQKAIFSLTTDYDCTHQSPVFVGDNFSVQIKLTNMTDKTIKVTMLPPPEIVMTTEENVNPVATGNEESHTFNPYETLIYNQQITVTEDLTAFEDGYHFGISTVINVLEPKELQADDMIYPFYDISISNLKIPVKSN